MLNKKTKEEIMDKWAPILDSMGVTGSKANWMAEYAQASLDNESNCENIYDTDKVEFPSISPIAERIAARTVGLDMVSVSPMPGPSNPEENNRIKKEVLTENRDRKIDALIEGKESYGGQLFYLDFKYGGTASK